MTTFGTHVQRHDADVLAAVIALASPYGKGLDPDPIFWAKVKVAIPGFKLIARFSGWQWHQSDFTIAYPPESQAKDFINFCKSQPGWAVADYIETPNEPFGGGSEALMYALYDRFMAECVWMARLEGKEMVVDNFGSGNFTPVEYRSYFPLTIATAKYHGAHEYGWPRVWSQNYFTGGGHALRCIAVMQEIRMTNPTAECFVTECGVTNAVIGGPDVGYQTRGVNVFGANDTLAYDASPESYWEDLKWYIEALSTHDFIKSAHVFGTGMNPDWATFEVVGTSIIDRAREWNLAQKEAPVVTSMPAPQFVLGFKTLADKLGEAVVGTPVEDEFYFSSSHVVQTTTKGLMWYHTGGQPIFLASVPNPLTPPQ